MLCTDRIETTFRIEIPFLLYVLEYLEHSYVLTGSWVTTSHMTEGVCVCLRS